MPEGIFKSLQIVEFDDARGFGGIYWRPDIAAARTDDAIFESGESFVYCAVIAVMEDQNLEAPRDFAGDANRKTVGVGSSQRELPVGQAETALEIFANPERVFGREHERDAFADAACDSVGDD